MTRDQLRAASLALAPFAAAVALLRLLLPPTIEQQERADPFLSR